jgi:murein L,D-transpeptidase YcbB/YkuD
VFSDLMTYLVLSPYWNVPPGIVAKDVIPAVRKDPGYLSSKKIRVFQGWSADAQEVSPTAVDWSKVSANNPGYRFRQDPGPANSLGRVKFMFPNKFNVYLHDTPSIELFEKTERAFSSGCIRVEKPFELAEYLLKADPKWTRPAMEAAIQRGKEQTVMLPRPVFVHLLYWTAWVEDDGIVQFRKDVYGRDKKLENALESPAPRP